MLTRQGYLVEEQRVTYLADIGPDNPLKPLQAAACTYRIAFGLRAGQTVLSLRSVASRDEKTTATLCADAASACMPLNGKSQPVTTQMWWLEWVACASLPATVAPVRLSSEGLPLSVQIVGPQFGDLSTIRLPN